MDKMTRIVLLCLAMAMIGGGIYLYTKYNEVKMVPATVTQVQWTCRTVVQRSYRYFVMVGKVPASMKGWRTVTFSDASGQGLEYACLRFSLTHQNQREVFYVTFFVTFVDARERLYQYRTKDIEEARAFHPESLYTLGFNGDDEIVNIHATDQR